MKYIILALYLFFVDLDLSIIQTKKSDIEFAHVQNKILDYMKELNIHAKYTNIPIIFSDNLKSDVIARCEYYLFISSKRRIVFNVLYRHLLKDNPKAALVIIGHEDIHCMLDFQQHDEQDTVMSSTLDPNIIKTYDDKYLETIIKEAILKYN